MHIQSPSILRIVVILALTPLLTACDSDLFSDNQDTPVVNQKTMEGDTMEGDTLDTKEYPWKMSQLTDNKIFSADFSCQQTPYVGDFQICHILLKHNDLKISGAQISIDGGMEAHGHGLPTSPILSSTNVLGQYKIEGLKFSMPGDWVVGFRITSNELFDQIIFNFSI